jgi:hypothetical protein
MAELKPDEGEAPVIVGLAEAAMHMYTSAINALPQPNDGEFHARADVILAGLRKLQTSLTTAGGRNRMGPSVAVALSEVRRLYDDLMAAAAAAPGASLGQQLYVARRRALLSAQEAANGAGLRADLLDALEAGEHPTEDEAVKLKELIEALGGSSEEGDREEPREAHPESFDESLAWTDHQ